MRPGWGDVLDRLLRTIETRPEGSDISRLCVVRDLRGRVRLAARARTGATIDAGTIEASLRAELGQWFAPPILWTDSPSSLEERRLAANLIDRLDASWPETWPRAYRDLAGAAHRVSVGRDGRWCGEQRARSKDIWLQQGAVRLPWPLRRQAPAVVSFYSFKGGVGRTTTLGIVALHLARQGHKVVAVDLDLEAPGLGRLFDVQTDRGVLDLLVEWSATGTIDADDSSCWSRATSVDERITVYPVGRMDASYIEQLASLDYAPRVDDRQSAVEGALRELLKQIRWAHDPDFILLDARSGLHDLGGLSLHALAHVDALVGRAGSTTQDGFNLVLDALTRRRAEEDLRVVMVQSFVPVDKDLQRHARDSWAATLYEMFEQNIHARLYPDGELPAVDDSTAMHFPWIVPDYDGVARADRLADIDESFINAVAYRQLADRVVERTNRGRSAGDDDGGVDDGAS